MKSKDDEFLLMSLVYAAGNNEKGLRLGFSKVRRGLDKRPYLLNSVLQDQVRAILEVDLKKYDMLAGRPDVARLNESFKKIFYGLYRHHFNKNFAGNIRNQNPRHMAAAVLKTFGIRPSAIYASLTVFPRSTSISS